MYARILKVRKSQRVSTSTVNPVANTSATYAARRRFSTMTAPSPSAAASDTDQPKAMEPIVEETAEDTTVVDDGMDEDAPESTENGNLVKTHVIMRFNANDRKTNVGVSC
jgi:hypothetical protein